MLVIVFNVGKQVFVIVTMQLRSKLQAEGFELYGHLHTHEIFAYMNYGIFHSH